VRQGRIFGPAAKLVLLALADRADQHGGGSYHVEEMASSTGLSGGAVRDAVIYLSSPAGLRFLRVSLTTKRGVSSYKLNPDTQKAAKLKRA
jgi:hypothetical protein